MQAASVVLKSCFEGRAKTSGVFMQHRVAWSRAGCYCSLRSRADVWALSTLLKVTLQERIVHDEKDTLMGVLVKRSREKKKVLWEGCSVSLCHGTYSSAS